LNATARRAGALHVRYTKILVRVVQAGKLNFERENSTTNKQLLLIDF